MHSNRDAAPALEDTEERTLGVAAPLRLPMRQAPAELARRDVVGPDLERECALGGARSEVMRSPQPRRTMPAFARTMAAKGESGASSFARRVSL